MTLLGLASPFREQRSPGGVGTSASLGQYHSLLRIGNQGAGRPYAPDRYQSGPEAGGLEDVVFRFENVLSFLTLNEARRRRAVNKIKL